MTLLFPVALPTEEDPPIFDMIISTPCVALVLSSSPSTLLTMVVLAMSSTRLTICFTCCTAVMRVSLNAFSFHASSGLRISLLAAGERRRRQGFFHLESCSRSGAFSSEKLTNVGVVGEVEGPLEIGQRDVLGVVVVQDFVQALRREKKGRN